MATINRHWLVTVTLKTQPMFRKGKLVNETTAWMADDLEMLYRFLQEHYRRRKYWKLVNWVEVITDDQRVPLSERKRSAENAQRNQTLKAESRGEKEQESTK